MKRLIIISVSMCLLSEGIFACREESRSGFSAQARESRRSYESTVSEYADSNSSSVRLQAYDEKQIENFNNQSTSKDIQITGGPPAERVVAGLDGLKLDE